MLRAKTIADAGSTFLVAVAAVALLGRLANDWYVGSQPAPSRSVEISGETLPVEALRHIRGRSAVMVVEFSDFECPACNSYARSSLPSIDKELISTGRIQYAIKHFPLDSIHANARSAAEAAECAGDQGHFWDMHARLVLAAPELTDVRIAAEAQRIGLDMSSFNECAEGGSAERVAADFADGVRLGVTGTPSFLIGTVNSDGSMKVQRRVTGMTTAQELAREIEEWVR